MAYINPICESIIVKFSCPECGEEVISDSLSVPLPDFSAEKNSDSMNYESYDIICDNCGHSYVVTIYNAMYGGEVEVSGVDSVNVEEEYAEEEYDDYVFDLTPENITKVLDEIESLSVPTKEYLYRQLYAGAITSMEAFLSSTLLREVLSSDATKRRFVEQYLPYRELSISFSNIYEQMETIDTTIQNTLRSLMYHNLAKIKPIYKDVLNVDLGDISGIMKAVPIRHDIVHRSGKSKEGIMHSITKEDVIAIVENVSSLISDVNLSLTLSSISSDGKEEVGFPF